MTPWLFQNGEGAGNIFGYVMGGKSLIFASSSADSDRSLTLWKGGGGGGAW